MTQRLIACLSKSTWSLLALALVLVLVGNGTAALAAGGPRPDSDPAKVAKASMGNWSRGWNTGDLDSIVATVKNGTYWDASLPAEGITGDKLREYAAGLFKAFPNSKFSYDHVKYTDDGVVYWEWTWTATHTGPFGDKPATNKALQVHGIDVIRVGKDGTVLIRSYWDKWRLLEAIGATK
ncbi:MAG: ester cyclase [Pseudomonadota bacterium]